MALRLLIGFCVFVGATLAFSATQARADTTTYSTAGTYTFTVPAGVTSVTFDVYGAQGGTGCGGGGTGGLGGESTLTVSTSPGTVYQLNVGGAGAINAAGSNGGAAGTATSGGGGGASDVRTGAFGTANRISVGGGGGGCSAAGANGGSGGGTTGGTGTGTGPGTGGTQSASGSATGSGNDAPPGSSTAGAGGGANGGGGGGGYFGAGGGGSAAGGGGGGGSGFGGTLTNGVQAGVGKIVITFAANATSPTTAAATNVTRRTATLHGSCASSTETYHFEYGKTTAYGSSTATATSSSASADLPTAITGLKPDTTYHFRIVSAGGSGADLTFTTSAHVPPPDTSAATAVTTTSATLHGVPHLAGIAYHFEYGLSSLGYVARTASVVATTADTDFSAQITGLTPGTVYYYRLIADGEASGQELTLTTTALMPDLAVTLTGPPTGVNGATFTYVVTVTSTGTGTVPAGTGIKLRWTGQGITRVVSSPNCVDTGPWLVCPTVATLAPGASTTITVVVRSRVRGSVHVDAQAAPAFTDPTPADDSASVDTALSAKRD